MNVPRMEEKAHVRIYAPTPLDHSFAVVSLDTTSLNMPAMVNLKKNGQCLVVEIDVPAFMILLLLL